MRILFLASSLEPGRDGVGDYVRLLAHACARLGHTCALLALNDPCVAGPLESFSVEGPGKIPILRLPATMTWRQREVLARDFRSHFSPDWMSLSLVCYAFEKRGILLGLAPFFRAITEGVPLHLMFHELWIGAGTPSSLRHRATGFLQRLGIRRLLSTLRPRLTTTSNPVYAAMLRQLGTEAGVLPLFGNIPVCDAHALCAADEALAGIGVAEGSREGWWIGLFFSGLHELWPPEPLMALLLCAASRAGKRLALVSVGRMGAGGEALWNRLKVDYADRSEFLNLAEQPAETISSLLQAADFGFASAPWQLIGKSGAAAAMLDHGLPVIIARDDFQPYIRSAGPPSVDPLFHFCDPELEAQLAAGLPKRPARARVDEIAARLCGDLRAASSPGP